MQLILWAIIALAAIAEGQAANKLTVVLGTPEELHLGGPISTGTCDDPSIVKIDATQSAVRLVGLKEGTTLCGFWAAGMTRHSVIEVTVVRDDDKPATGRP